MVRTRNINPLSYTGKVLATVTRRGDKAVNRNGVAKLVAGNVVITDVNLRADEQIFVSKREQIGAGSGILTVALRSNGVNFDVASLDATGTPVAADVSTINFTIAKARP